jgi:hypothetical protein
MMGVYYSEVKESIAVVEPTRLADPRVGDVTEEQKERCMSNVATLATEIDTMVGRFPAEIQAPMRDFTVWMLEELHVSHKDFSELKDTVQRIATLQEMTEHRVSELTSRVEQLAEAQTRTEQNVERLAEAQERLAEAQGRTEQKVEQLAEAQQRTEGEIQELRKSLSDQIAALGSRWGIYNEGTFRSTIYGVFKEMDGITVKEGDYGGRQVDVVIRNGEHILLEITSRMHAKDIESLYRSADDYEQREGVKPKLMVATSYISPRLMQKIMGLARPIEIFSYEGEE